MHQKTKIGECLNKCFYTNPWMIYMSGYVRRRRNLMRIMTILFALSLCCSAFAMELPTKLEGKQIKYVLETTNGDFASYKGHVFETSFLKNNSYSDIDLTTGLLNDGGSYHYFTTSDDTAELHYIIDSDGPWRSMHFVEKLRFTSPDQGYMEGSHVGDIACTYSGTFTIHEMTFTAP
jgi:hypothetical protein